MISVKVSNKLEMMTVASPAYFQTYGMSQTPDDQHRCIELRLPSYERIQSWEFKNSQQNSEVQTISPEFSMVVSHARSQLKAGLDGLGIVWLPKIMVETEIQKGNFVRILED
jgi:DNA-binding transcriptional LysR family regulator